MEYNENQRKEVINTFKGKTIEFLEWDEEGKYWTFTFVEGGECSFRFMSELV